MEDEHSDVVRTIVENFLSRRIVPFKRELEAAVYISWWQRLLLKSGIKIPGAKGKFQFPMVLHKLAEVRLDELWHTIV